MRLPPIRNFTAGLWVAGGKDSSPPNTLRRLLGTDRVRVGRIRSRFGSSLISQVGPDPSGGFPPPEQLGPATIRFGDDIYFFTFTSTKLLNLYRQIPNSTVPTLVRGGLPLQSFGISMVVMPPNSGASDALFIALADPAFGLFKVLPGGLAEKWGIAAPSDSVTAVALPALTKIIENFEQGVSDIIAWTADNAVRVTFGQFGGQLGLYSLDIIVLLGSVAGATRTYASPLNLASFGPDGNNPSDFPTSAEQDYFAFDVWAQASGKGANADLSQLDWIEVAVDTNDGKFTSFFSRLVTVAAAGPPESNQVPSVVIQSVRGNKVQLALFKSGGGGIIPLGVNPLIAEGVTDVLSLGLASGFTFFGNSLLGSSEKTTNTAFLQIPQFLGFQKLNAQPATWAHVQIPKASFTAFGSQPKTPDNPQGLPDWRTVKAIRFVIGATNQGNAPGGAIEVAVDNIGIEGGYGREGDIGYRITYRNSTTGTRSNPNPTEIRVSNVKRQAVQLHGLPYQPPLLTDPQVDQLEIWRTLGGGVQWFLVDQVPLADIANVIVAGTYIDVTSDVLDFNVIPAARGQGTVHTAGISTIAQLSNHQDALNIFYGLQYSITVHNGGTPDNPNGTLIQVTQGNLTEQRTVVSADLNTNQLTLDVAVDWSAPNLQFTFLVPVPIPGTDILPLDNILPDTAFNDVVGPMNGVVFWLSNDPLHRGRVYFSPPGRPEAVQGFIELINNTDILTKLISWNNSVWAFSVSRVYEVVADPNVFFFFREIFGTVGTSNPYSVIGTPIGIFYQADDGLRIFDGVQCALSGFDAISPLFRGESAENLLPFNIKLGAARPDELVLGDTIQVLGFRTASQPSPLGISTLDAAWRVIANQDGWFGRRGTMNSCYYDARLKRLLIGVENRLLHFEDPTQVEDVDQPIPFEVEIPSLLVDVAQVGLIQLVYFDIRTNGQMLTPTLITDDIEIPLPPFATIGATRQNVEFTRTVNGRVLGVRLTGMLVQPVELFGTDMDASSGLEGQNQGGQS